MAYLDKLASYKKEEREANKLSHNGFIKDSLVKSLSDIDFNDFGKEIIICKEPLEFEYIFDNIAGDKEKCTKKFEELLNSDEFCKYILGTKPKNCLWSNKTNEGINLRPGRLNNDINNPESIVLGDASVHGIVVGRTGSGKSVFLNNLIFNLLYKFTASSCETKPV